MYELGDIRDLSLSLCINFSSFPTIAGSKYFNYDDTKISYLSIIYKYSPHARQREQIIEIYKNLSKIDIHQYETFIQSIFTEKYMVEILSLTSTISAYAPIVNFGSQPQYQYPNRVSPMHYSTV